MTNNRRNFLKDARLSGAYLFVTGMMQAYAATSVEPNNIKEQVEKKERQHFDICGYAATQLETVRIGVVRIGNRRYSAVERLIKHKLFT